MEIEGERVKELLEHRIAQLEVKLEQEQKLSNNTFCVDNIKNNAKLFKFYSGFENYDVFAWFSTFSGEKQLPN